ncbi:hypothetical protein YOLOSWAG_53 [Erwinia phage vB_EamM_Yoloswag]|uniref:Uncharacterized protein n=1 Tax=Erwinia phage vB_EamM_Yoloswag TaxID=1958956 RepID=A0A1S6L2X5_9CAUD|nr:hypothetical protein HOR66_gp053 [Erwinia phage vB_EamM_Yoloswag]AQT28537.1 hypothetical protein YOLOSWAG_53 [Erwinia phage vB_EamM_Yoloswag]
MTKLQKRQVFLLEDTDLETVLARTSRNTVNLLRSATPNSKAVLEQRSVKPCVYRIKGTDTSFFATLSGELHENIVACCGLELVHQFDFFRREGLVFERKQDMEIPILNSKPRADRFQFDHKDLN